MQNNLFTCILACLVMTINIIAQENDTCSAQVLKLVGKKTNLSNFLTKPDGGRIVSDTFKIWPYNKNLLLTAFAYDAGVEDEKVLVVAVVDLNKMSVLNTFKGIIKEDAVTEAGPGCFKFDTGRFQLSQAVRAFGLRFNTTGNQPSCAQGSWGDDLILFIAEGDSLRPVLAIPMKWQSILDGDCLESSLSPKAVWKDCVRSLSIETKSNNGFYDLRIVEKVSIEGGIGQPSLTKWKNRTEAFIMRYDGERYRIEKNEKHSDCFDLHLLTYLFECFNADETNIQKSR